MLYVPPAPSLAQRLFDRRGWIASRSRRWSILVAAPLANLVAPEGSFLHLSDASVALVGKLFCYAMLALAMDLVWGYARNIEPRPWHLLRARRLRLRHVSDAPDRP